MSRKYLYIVIIGFLFLAGYSQISVAFGHNELKQNANDTELKIAATSGILADFVETITGQEINPIIDFGTCPAHYDVQPEDAALIAEADIIFYHGFEGEWFETLRNENNPSAQLIMIGDLVSGPWLPPEKAKEYLTAITEKLTEIYPEKSSIFNKNLNDNCAWIDGNATLIKENFASSSYYGANTVVMEFQAMFANWLGLKVITTFGSDETCGIQEIESIVATAKENGCSLVVMNLPSGTDVGKDIATEIGAKYAIWGNFVGELESESYIDLLWKNMEAVKDPISPNSETIGINLLIPLILIIGISIIIIGMRHKRNN